MACASSTTRMASAVPGDLGQVGQRRRVSVHTEEGLGDRAAGVGRPGRRPGPRPPPAAFACGKTATRARDRRQPSIRLAWFRASETIRSSGPASALTDAEVRLVAGGEDAEPRVGRGRRRGGLRAPGAQASRPRRGARPRRRTRRVGRLPRPPRPRAGRLPGPDSRSRQRRGRGADAIATWTRERPDSSGQARRAWRRSSSASSAVRSSSKSRMVVSQQCSTWNSRQRCFTWNSPPAEPRSGFAGSPSSSCAARPCRWRGP